MIQLFDNFIAVIFIVGVCLLLCRLDPDLRKEFYCGIALIILSIIGGTFVFLTKLEKI